MEQKRHIEEANDPRLESARTAEGFISLMYQREIRGDFTDVLTDQPLAKLSNSVDEENPVHETLEWFDTLLVRIILNKGEREKLSALEDDVFLTLVEVEEHIAGDQYNEFELETLFTILESVKSELFSNQHISNELNEKLRQILRDITAKLEKQKSDTSVSKQYDDITLAPLRLETIEGDNEKLFALHAYLTQVLKQKNYTKFVDTVVAFERKCTEIRPRAIKDACMRALSDMDEPTANIFIEAAGSRPFTQSEVKTINTSEVLTQKIFEELIAKSMFLIAAYDEVGSSDDEDSESKKEAISIVAEYTLRNLSRINNPHEKMKSARSFEDIKKAVLIGLKATKKINGELPVSTEEITEEAYDSSLGGDLDFDSDKLRKKVIALNNHMQQNRMNTDAVEKRALELGYNNNLINKFIANIIATQDDPNMEEVVVSVIEHEVNAPRTHPRFENAFRYLNGDKKIKVLQSTKTAIHRMKSRSTMKDDEIQERIEQLLYHYNQTSAEIITSKEAYGYIAEIGFEIINLSKEKAEELADKLYLKRVGRSGTSLFDTIRSR